jgi:uncharacterized membrane protein
MNFELSLFLSFLLVMSLDFGWLMFNSSYYLNLANKIQKEPLVVKIPGSIAAYIMIFITFYLYAKLITYDDKVLLNGLLFGLGVYGTFSFTTCVFFKNYTYYNAIIDTLWGPVLYISGGLLFNYLYNKKDKSIITI